MKNYTKIGLVISGLILVFFLFQLPKRVVDSKARALTTQPEEEHHDDHGHEENSALSSIDSLKLIALKQNLKTQNSAAVKALLADSIAEIYGKNFLVDSSVHYYGLITELLPETGGYELAGNGYYSLFRLTQQEELADKIVNLYNSILEQDSSRNDLLAKIGFVKVISGQGPPMEGVALVKQALANDPENIEVLLRYGELFQIRGSNDQAIVQYQKAVDLDPKNLDARIYLVEALLASNKKEECTTHLHKIKELNKGQDVFIEEYVDQHLKELL